MNIGITLHNDRRNVETKALIDSGASGIFMDEQWATQCRFRKQTLAEPLNCTNVDGTGNKHGFITHYVWADTTLGGQKVPVRYLLMSLGKDKVIYGFSWLQYYNPSINWQDGTITLPAVAPTRISLMRVNNFTEYILQRTQIDPIAVAPQKECIDESEHLKAFMDDVRPKEVEREPDEPETPKPFIRKIMDGAMEWAKSMQQWLPVRRFSPAMEMAQKAEEDKKKVPLEELVPEEYHDYLDTFQKGKAERFPAPRPYDHCIQLKDDFVPRRAKNYNLSHDEQKLLDEFLEENLRKGYIRKSSSPQASAFFFVGKKDGSKRPCQDYRYLNDSTIKNAYPLPLVTELVQQMKGKKVFTKLDLRNGYNNVRIKDGDQWKGAFTTNRGLFEPTVMFFGMCNSPATFQSMMNDLFHDEIQEGWLVIYMDDMLIASEDMKEHRRHVRRILKKLKENDLYLKGEKCIFHTTKLEFLGLILEPNQISMDQVKVQGIQDWPEPKTVKQVRSFLGFGNFYRKFIAHYSELARPLVELTMTVDKQNSTETYKDGTPKKVFEWTDKHQKAFEELKRRFITAPVLRIPDPSKPFVLETDASKVATGGCLKQQDDQGKWHPCGFISQSFSSAEQNYEIYDRELLGVIRGLTEWRHLLEGHPEVVTCQCDHKNLTYWKEGHRLTPRQRRWHLWMSRFNIALQHVPGKHLVVPDTMSRNPIYGKTTDEDDTEVMLPDNLFLCECTLEDVNNELVLPGHMFLRYVNTELRERIANTTDLDETLQDVLNALKGYGTLPNFFGRNTTLDEWALEGNIMTYKGLVYVPKDEELRRDIIKMHHDHPMAGHPGHFRTLKLVGRDYFWPGMSMQIKKYVKGCATCQQNKVITHPTNPPLMPIESKAERPFAQISLDMITHLPESDGHNSILTVVDHGLTKGVIFAPCSDTLDAEGAALLYFSNVYRRFGLPDNAISDRGPQFASKFMKALCELLGVKQSLSTAYHPQTDGQTE